MEHFVLGREANKEILAQALELDKLVYPVHYQTIYAYALSWYEKNRDIFVFVLDGEKVVGYICLLPISAGIYQEIRKGVVKEDITIPQEDILAYKDGEEYNLYIFSTVLHPAYHGSEYLKLMLEGVQKNIFRLCKEGVKFNKILADTISPKGIKLARSLGFREICQSNHDSIIYESDFANLLINLEDVN